MEKSVVKKLRQQEIDALLLFRSKGSCWHVPCRVTALEAWLKIEKLLTRSEKTAILKARERALNDETKKPEFEKVMGKLFERLKIDKKGSCCE
jgi:hypothetical protein